MDSVESLRDLNPANITDPNNMFHALFQNNLVRQNSSSDTNNPHVDSNREIASIRSDELLLDPPVVRGALEKDEWILVQMDNFGAPTFHIIVSKL